MSLQIRPIRLDELHALQDFIRDRWNADHAFVRSSKLLRWQHFENPFKRISHYGEDELCFLGAWSDLGLRAVLGEIPCEFTDRGRRVAGTWLALWRNIDEERHPGAGIRLLQRVTSGPAEFVGGIGINARVRQAYELFRFRVCDDLPLWIVLNPEAPSQLVRRKQTWTRSRGDELAARFAACAPVPGGGQVQRGATEAAEWDGFWARLRSGFVAVDRSFVYMNWRYIGHPHYRYEWVRIYAGGALRAVGIFRVEPAADERVIHVVEFLGDADGRRELARSLCAAMRELEASFISFRCSQVSSFESWRAVGGAVYDERNPCYEIPSLFQPIVPVYRPLMWGYRAAEKDGPVLPESCYVTRSDGDQDRPSRIETR